MRLLATLMTAITVLTCGLFANALAAAEPDHAATQIERVATNSASHLPAK